MNGILECSAPRPGEKCAGCSEPFKNYADTYTREGLRFFCSPACEADAHKVKKGGERVVQ